MSAAELLRGRTPIEPSGRRSVADDASVTLEEFAITVAHELRTPLAIVELATTTMLEHVDQLGAVQTDDMLRLVHRNTRLATMILARLELVRGVGTGDVPLAPESLDLSEVARETAADLADVLLSGHRTTIHAPEAVMVHADPTAVREILSNLLSNAAKYSPRGSCIDVSVVQHEDDAQVTVRDRGRGVVPADVDQVFEKFQQVDPGGRGIGLGLYVSRCLARVHGGDLVVSATTARGSQFCLTLPGAAER